jgi:hypothetical protein
MIFNLPGIVMAVVGFAIAFGVGELVGVSAEGPLMMIAGPMIAIFDLAYRRKTENGHWLIPNRGGSLLFIPAWVLGLFWAVLGAF